MAMKGSSVCSIDTTGDDFSAPQLSTMVARGARGNRRQRGFAKHLLLCYLKPKPAWREQMDFTVALAQIKPKLGCLADNLTMVEAAVERGIREKAGLVVFPELALTGYFLKDLVPEVALP